MKRSTRFGVGPAPDDGGTSTGPARPGRRAVLAAGAWGALAAGVVPRGAARAQAPARATPAPLFGGLGTYAAPDVSDSPLARRLFAQGMVLSWGFNPEESARSFAGAQQADPDCAAACWGEAWALGPTINADMAAADAPRVRAALQRAVALAPRAAPRWQAAIAALAVRHAGEGTAADEEGYATALRAMARRFAHDADVLTLAAEALMNLNPYDWWQDDGRPQPWTGEIERTLAAALRVQPWHVGAAHLWIHLLERSPAPGRALAAADLLRHAVPGSAHLLHMPSHIDMRLGRYAEAVRANERAAEADRLYLAQVDAQGAYRVGYVAHNHHFLWAAASMQGRGARSLEAAQEAWTAACGPTRPDAGSRAAGTLQHFEVLPLFTLVRFGRWQQLLTGTRPPDGNAPYPLAMWHYARGTALSRLGRPADARAELMRLERLAADPVVAGTRVKTAHAASALCAIARATLQGDLALAEGRHAEGLRALREAVALEDGLDHDEPHLWLAPTRHALGAALLTLGRAPEAVRVFREDLAHYPDNGWSLSGLLAARRSLRQTAAASETARRLAAAWRDADPGLVGPRY